MARAPSRTTNRGVTVCRCSGTPTTVGLRSLGMCITLLRPPAVPDSSISPRTRLLHRRIGSCDGQRSLARPSTLGLAGSTVSRELRRNQEIGGGYRASSAHAMAYHRASRPKVAKRVGNLAPREKVEHDLEKRYSPEQITGRLRLEFPDDPEMRVSSETIVGDRRQALDSEGVGLTRALRCRPRRRIRRWVRHRAAAPTGRLPPLLRRDRRRWPRRTG